MKNLIEKCLLIAFGLLVGIGTTVFADVSYKGLMINGDVDVSSELATVITDETGTGALVFGTSPTFTTSILQSGDSADAGFFRLQNASIIGWEASPAGTDFTMQVDTAEILQVSGAVNSASTITSSNATDVGWAVIDPADNIACNTSCTNACVFGIANATGTTVTGLVLCTDATADLCLCAGAN